MQCDIDIAIAQIGALCFVVTHLEVTTRYYRLERCRGRRLHVRDGRNRGDEVRVMGRLCREGKERSIEEFKDKAA